MLSPVLEAADGADGGRRVRVVVAAAMVSRSCSFGSHGWTWKSRSGFGEWFSMLTVIGGSVPPAARCTAACRMREQFAWFLACAV